MICLMDSGSRLSIATIVFYTCIWIPVKQMKQAILDVFSTICSQLQFRVAKIGFRDHDDEYNSSSRSVVMDDLLPPAKFNDVVVCAVVQLVGDGDGDNSERCCCYGGGGGDGESCSICLAEYDGEDMVFLLPRCGHVFHMECINSWLHRSQFTCPLCRDLFLCVNNVDDVRAR